MRETDNIVIEFKDVGFSFDDRRSVFRNLSLKLKAASFYVLRGPSGSGKSTFLRLINRLEAPEEGEIYFKSRPVSEYSPARLRRSILYIQQTPVAIDASVRRNLLLPFTFKSNRDLSPPDQALLEEYLHTFLLDGIGLDDSALTLSVGQLQRLCFIRGLLLSPEMLLLDEPLSALDAESASVVQQTAERLSSRSGMTVLMVSHQNTWSPSFTPRILHLSGGRIQEGP